MEVSIADSLLCRRPSPRLGSPRVASAAEQSSYGVDRAMSYRLPPWIRPPLEDLELPGADHYLEPSSSTGAGLEDETAMGFEQQSTEDTPDEAYPPPEITIAGSLLLKQSRKEL